MNKAQVTNTTSAASSGGAADLDVSKLTMGNPKAKLAMEGSIWVRCLGRGGFWCCGQFNQSKMLDMILSIVATAKAKTNLFPIPYRKTSLIAKIAKSETKNLEGKI